MKPLKYTVAALAILAAASFSSSAMAASTGDLLLGLENSSTSLEFDLGAFSTLTSGETFNLGTNIETTLGNGTLTWDIAATGLAVGAQSGGLNAKEVAFTATSIGTIPATNPTAPITNLNAETNGFSGGTAVTSGTSSNGTAFSAVTLANSNASSFAFNLAANGGNYGFGSSAGTFGDSFPDTASITLYDKKSGAGTTPVVAGTFQFSVVGGNDILTFDPVAAPEPSAYALGICAVALFFVLRRRSTVA